MELTTATILERERDLMEEQYLLYMQDITKKFGAFTANDRVSLRIKRGEIHALMGENGAGKSTLMNILSGLYQKDGGKIVFDGKEVSFKGPQEAKALGIGMVYQHFMLIEAMTVVENVMLSLKSQGFQLPLAKTRAKIKDLSEKYQLDVDPDALVGDLSVGAQQRVEIIKVLCVDNAKLIVLDEPTAVLTPAEAQGLFAILRRLNEQGHTIIFISHKLKEVMEICDRITVLRLGKSVAEVNKADTTMDELGSFMVGRSVVMDHIPMAENIGNAFLSLEDVGYKSADGVERLSIPEFQVKKGEIVGIAGVDGNGQSELAQLLMGVVHPQMGQVKLDGVDMSGKSVKDFIQAGMALIPEDRNAMGLVGAMSIYENLALKNMEQAPNSKSGGWFIQYKELKEYAKKMVERYDIRTSGIDQSVGSLSGGNQQKVILAREIESNCKILVAVHPTRGVDIGASEYIHSKIQEFRDAGGAVLVISADLDEVLRLSDRCCVMYEGKIMGFVDPQNPDMQKLSLMMAGKEGTNESEIA
ncbi:ABC transporter ATP-binding protein [Chakrabartyella piscis]|uniref:ABC transporter ATP-binding protein n=1 Tax=Chakrabartyella piscis TaxID=2918914 RepID=UPI002958D083|nr:ABC transporter ATP-binding protein [Chakrabartyella piscis]